MRASVLLLSLLRQQQALEFFKLNTYLFPLSANTYDSLAEIHWLLGHTHKAIEYYKKVLGLEPENKYAEEQLEKLREIQGKINLSFS